MKGRKPLPRAIIEARGGVCSRPAEMAVETAAPKCPTHLKGGARAEWRFIVPELLKLGVLGRIDRAALALYCAAYARHIKAEKELAKSGEVVTSPNGHLIQSPWLPISNKAAAIAHKFLTEFGLTPSARMRIGKPVAPDGRTSAPNDEFFTPDLKLAQ